MEISHPNIKYDWYQSDTHVVLNIMVKQVKPENVRIDLIDQQLKCTAKLPDDSDFTFCVNLSHQVYSNEMKWKVFSTKIEIKLKKYEPLKWNSLEKKQTENFSSSKGGNVVKVYPSSKPKKKDWDKLEQELKNEEANEKLEGEAALNQLFQKIYADASDETKKAMNKSFLESGGTVLSTNWNEVGEKKVEVKPPEGMEFKKWDD
ncbi:protein SGT1 homolog isoform X1 [Parasteatoda tepidariorum]|uniref:protein SGT1 homolog isoform X1 n=2 Tax=Parasteatoda tepidariorum TaxID=114398 RepID=UPI00077FC080|nr:protein SGT1 homolog isoform X1 [Parasteatoda tepidariorum]